MLSSHLAEAKCGFLPGPGNHFWETGGRVVFYQTFMATGLGG